MCLYTVDSFVLGDSDKQQWAGFHLLKLVLAVSVLIPGTSWGLSSANFLYQDSFLCQDQKNQVVPNIHIDS